MAHTCAARAGVILAAERFAAGEVCLALCDVNREAVEDVAATLRAGGEWGGLVAGEGERTPVLDRDFPGADSGTVRGGRRL